MKSLLLLPALSLVLLSLAGCKKREDAKPSPAALIVGTWDYVSERRILTVTPGQGTGFDITTPAAYWVKNTYTAQGTTTTAVDPAAPLPGGSAGTYTIDNNVLTVYTTSGTGANITTHWAVKELTAKRLLISISRTMGPATTETIYLHTR